MSATAVQGLSFEDLVLPTHAPASCFPVLLYRAFLYISKLWLDQPIHLPWFAKALIWSRRSFDSHYRATPAPCRFFLFPVLQVLLLLFLIVVACLFPVILFPVFYVRKYLL